ncbi:dienelactone hydrolase family protein [Aurantiacibacter gangjinensis]|uniref:Dienelactone hydrolase n=1 Tax=Aurantiacibacter gangjinensis TaxID=502682 RepID=A0A0G9ML26_9SPHN|nr:dienelactone hydrolase family protein [Aurantiacibacter gangjinensis]APE27178.1 N-formylglutamate deformylase [Aurantiacibacter gangjinensis]KLE31314.1 dienelactone hydrolase [Aurantiacibacter gangjinensis]
MCKQTTHAGPTVPTFDRRQFALLTGSATLAACTGIDGELDEDLIGTPTLTEDDVQFATADGEMDALFVRPSAGTHPAVILWPDIAGVRDAKRMMARRLAEAGYAVLLVNPYYRDVTGQQFASFANFASSGGFQTVRPWRDKLSSEAIMRDADAIVDFLDDQDGVDRARRIGTQGYCMGGPFTVYSAHARPDRVGVAASFHGGGLVREDDHSPHRLLAETPDTNYIFAIAQDDDAEAPDHKTVLRRAASNAEVGAEVEVYSADHGWCVPDSPAYNHDEAERAWSRLLAFYEGL